MLYGLLNDGLPVTAVWTITVKEDGNIISQREIKNLITNAGRVQLIENLLALSGSAGIVCMGVGASTTAADRADTHLTHELIDAPYAARKPLTNTSSAALSPSDIESGTYTGGALGSNTYYRRISVQAVWTTADLNGNYFGEYALFTLTTLPATPSSTSGVMLNHLIDSPATLKTSGREITSRCDLYF